MIYENEDDKSRSVVESISELILETIASKTNVSESIIGLISCGIFGRTQGSPFYRLLE